SCARARSRSSCSRQRSRRTAPTSGGSRPRSRISGGAWTASKQGKARPTARSRRGCESSSSASGSARLHERAPDGEAEDALVAVQSFVAGLESLPIADVDVELVHDDARPEREVEAFVFEVIGDPDPQRQDLRDHIADGGAVAGLPDLRVVADVGL